MTTLPQLAHKVRAQITQFSGKLSKGLKKPTAGFVEEMVYGLSSSGSVLISEISRSLNEDIRLIKTENLLCPNLVKENTLLIIDLSDISKKYAQKMEYLAHVRDGSEGCISSGYWTCQVVGYEENELIPLCGNLCSAEAPDFRSENHEIFKSIDFVSHYTQGKGIWVMDRGGDRSQLYDYLFHKDQKFIVRLAQKRHLLAGKNLTIKSDIFTIAQKMKLPYHQNVIRQKEGLYHYLYPLWCKN